MTHPRDDKAAPAVKGNRRTYQDTVEGLTERLQSATTTAEKERLWEDLYPKLKNVARNRIAGVGKRGLESPTELVHDMYDGLRKALERPTTQFKSRADFLAYAAQAMRHHLAAKAKRDVQGALLAEFLALMTEDTIDAASPELTIALSEAIDIVAKEHPRAVRAFQLRYYAGHGREAIVEEHMVEDYRTKSLLSADLTLVKKALARLLRPLR